MWSPCIDKAENGNECKELQTQTMNTLYTLKTFLLNTHAGQDKANLMTV